jgi:SAM-dependent methyltransferase
LNLLDIVHRHASPEPWADVSKIPWDDPTFSARMLREHLTQDHDAASRRTAIIDQQTRWIHEVLLGGIPSAILDLGCGPGLYCNQLARLGHACAGIDFGPASIEYARAAAAADDLTCTFILGDLRATEFDRDCDLIMLLFGEFNTFQRADVLEFLTRGRESLNSDGCLIAEVHTRESIRANGAHSPSWSAQERGLFSDRAHIRVNDASWDEASQTTVERHYIIDAETAEVSLYGTTTQSYTRDAYEALFGEAGFSRIEWRDDWPNPAHEREFDLALIRR